ncbi:uncharacterized protein YecE (DUF72 family) [Tamilnaduibacter salinus]|uniref:Uncharacterized protein YecE (DUF72 family) n=1 Tax=Tamilnaduibacter salinus TaxID=1484056 RepID=A0A2U1CTK4_9GAMM|nr:DUF72 domain-containing protein [Tamilnaduibacter salinus]PVY70034.1 uncharacterized protein YecE (DUF72 family) [Tamilnaduibacter salinus]
MTTPYSLGCPQWQDAKWNDLLPPGSSALARYSQIFQCVEGNTTFYATPTREQCEQWRAQVPDDFRFLFKFPRAITHDRLLGHANEPVRAFLDTLEPLNDVLGPFLLQLPAAFTPEHLTRLWRFLDTLPEPYHCTVEVRHPAFFEKGDAEKALNRGLRERRTARVCLDSRALFTATPDTDIIRDAQRKKPQRPVHLLPVDARPVVRYIGHPDLETNRRFLAPWVERVHSWIEEGQRPFVFMHMPDNGDAVSLARLWSELLHERMPALAPLNLAQHQPQIGLFSD